jgi:hypothetical protein
MGAILDPTSDPVDNTLTKIGVDATKPGGADFAQRLTIADEQAPGSAISSPPLASGSNRRKYSENRVFALGSAGFRQKI